MAVTVTYDANGGTGAPSPSTSSEVTGTVGISPVLPTRNGYVFLYWTENKDGTGNRYRPSFSYVFDASTTIYAQWVFATCRLDYNLNGGSGITDVAVAESYGTVINLTEQIPVREGYRFLGWATSKANADKGIVEYLPEATYRVHKRAVLWAVWLPEEWKKADTYIKMS